MLSYLKLFRVLLQNCKKSVKLPYARPFFLLEILLCISLVALCVTPLIRGMIYANRQLIISKIESQEARNHVIAISEVKHFLSQKENFSQLIEKKRLEISSKELHLRFEIDPFYATMDIKGEKEKSQKGHLENAYKIAVKIRFANDLYQASPVILIKRHGQ